MSVYCFGIIFKMIRNIIMYEPTVKFLTSTISTRTKAHATPFIYIKYDYYISVVT